MKLTVKWHVQGKEEELNFDGETVDQLRAEVKSIFNIDPYHQELTCKGRKLMPGTLKENELNEGDVIVMKERLYLKIQRYDHNNKPFEFFYNFHIDAAATGEMLMEELSEHYGVKFISIQCYFNNMQLDGRPLKQFGIVHNSEIVMKCAMPGGLKEHQQIKESRKQIFLKIQRYDHDDKPIGSFNNFHIDAAATGDILMEKLSEHYVVELRNINCYFNDEQLDGNSLDGFGIKHNSEIVMKHVMLDKWKEYLQRIEELEELSGREVKSNPATQDLIRRMKERARSAAELLETLEQTRFFNVYKEFSSSRDENIKRTGVLLLLLDQKWFEKAFRNYFEKRSPDSVVAFKWPDNKRFTGAQLASVVTVTSSNQGKKVTTRYYAKSMGNMPKPNTFPLIEKPVVDLREVFVYRLLCLIGLGAEEVHVVPGFASSGYVYLATKTIDGFYTADGNSIERIESDDPKTVSKKKPQPSAEDKQVAEAQMAMLIWLLHLTDLGSMNQGNHGYVELQTNTHKLKIVDFRVLARNETPEFKKKEVKTGLKLRAEEWKLMDNFKEVLKQMKEDSATKEKFEEDEKVYEVVIKPKEANNNKQWTTDEIVNIVAYVNEVKKKLNEIVEEQQGGGAAKKPRTD